MKFLDLKRQYKLIKHQINKATEDVLESTVFIGGLEVQKIEKQISDLYDLNYGIGVNSGTDALKLSLRALGIKSGDEVITSPFTFIATAEAIAELGAKPVFVDIDKRTFSINPLKIEEKINEKTKAIMPIHIFGQSADMDSIVNIAKKYNLFIIEDAAQSIGAEGIGKGDLTCFSFFPTKNLGCCGDGGMIVTSKKELRDKLLLLRNHGSSPNNKYINLALGVNSRLDAIQAAVLNVKFKYLLGWNNKRKENAEYYTNNLNGVGDIKTPYIQNDHVFNQYTIKTRSRNQLKKYLEENNIPTMIYYILPLHKQPIFKKLSFNCPVADNVSDQVLSLPIYPELEKEEQDYIIQTIKKFYE